MRGALVAALLGVVALTALARIPFASAHDDHEPQVSQADYDRAAQAALKAVGGGRVHDVDLDNENGAKWEVEITTTDGRAVDVLLDANFKVIDISGETDSNEPQRSSQGHSSGHDDDYDDDDWDD